MREIVQDDITFKSGNCFSACIASILEVPLKNIPNFHTESPRDFDKNVAEWCKSQDFILLDITMEDPSLINSCYVIANGTSPRNKDFLHSVVWFDGEIVHDPHPNGCGLADDPETFTIFIMKGVNHAHSRILSATKK